MDRKIGRNDPCPCGSGKKYKQCCLGKEKAGPKGEPERKRNVSRGAVERALSWLGEHHSKGFSRLIMQGFCQDAADESLQRLADLREELLRMYEINAVEWALSDGLLEMPGKRKNVPVIDLLLGPKGPLFSTEQAEYLRFLSESPLDLYEVLEVVPGEGFSIQSVLGKEAEAEWIGDRSASESAEPGQFLGLRVLPTNPIEISGAVYPIPDQQALTLKARLERLLADRVLPRREAVTRLIISSWIATLTAPPPDVHDASTGDPILLTEIHYRVLDEAEVRRRLNEHPDLESDAGSAGDEEESWFYSQELVTGQEDDRNRIAWSLSFRSEDRLTVFARTKQLADRAEEFVNDLVGKTARRLVRETQAPFGGAAPVGVPSDRPSSRPDDYMDSLNREDRSVLYRDLIHDIYRNWADDPIPALDDKTPREAIRSKAGRREVRRLIRSYQADENHQARDQDREPVDFGFLFEELGIEN